MDWAYSVIFKKGRVCMSILTKSQDVTESQKDAEEYMRVRGELQDGWRYYGHSKTRFDTEL